MAPSVLLAALILMLATTRAFIPGAAPLSPVTPAAPAAIFPTWINGADCATEPKIQVYAYDANTYILRQSMCTDY